MIIIRFLIIYLPLQEFLLKWLPVNETVFSAMRLLPDLLISALLLFLVMKKVLRGSHIPRVGGRVDVFLVAFMLWAIFSLLWNPLANPIIAVANNVALLRYVALIYIVLLIKPSDRDVSIIVRLTVISVFLQALIGVFQYLGEIPARDFLAARSFEVGVAGLGKSFTGDKFEGQNDLMGTMGDTINFGYLMLLGLLLVLGRDMSSKRKLLLSACLLLLLFFSGSRIVFLAGLFAILLFTSRRGAIVNISVVSFAAVLLLLAAVILSQTDLSATALGLENKSFFFMLTDDYLANAMNQRLGLVAIILPKILAAPKLLIGFSADKFLFADVVGDYVDDIPPMLAEVLVNVLEDVYWIALLVYYGIIGFAFWAAFMIMLYKKIRPMLKSDIGVERLIAFVACGLLLLAIPLNMFNQAFESRIFSFNLWLFCGFAVYMQKKRFNRNYCHDAHPAGS